MTHTGVQPVRSAGARHSGTQAGTSVSQIAMLIMVSLQICTKWKLQSEALTRTHCQLYGTLQLRRRATERLRDTSNDTSLSNTATKGL